MISTILTGAVYIAIVYMLVNPSSPAAATFTSITTVLSNLIQAAVNGGSTGGTNTGGKTV